MQHDHPISRRALLGSAGAAALHAQQAPVASPEDERAASQKQQRSSFEQMKKVAVPMSVEPATVFRP